jgi:DNA-binding transcriptional MerR regulator
MLDGRTATRKPDHATDSGGPVPGRAAAGPGAAAAGRGLSITEAARVTGVTAHTLRYYERAGLMLDRVTRASSAHRRYTEAEVRWIGTLTALRRTGMPIRQIAEYAALVRAGEGNEAERLALLAGHRRRVAEQLAEVGRHLAAIDLKIDMYVTKTSAPPHERTTS